MLPFPAAIHLRQPFSTSFLHLHTHPSFPSSFPSSSSSSTMQSTVSSAKESTVFNSFLSRNRSIFRPDKCALNFLQIQGYKLKKVYIREALKNSISLSDTEDLSVDDEITTKKSSRSPKKPNSRGRKKATTYTPISETMSGCDFKEENDLVSNEVSNKQARKGRKKAVAADLDENQTEKKAGRRSYRKAVADVDAETIDQVLSSQGHPEFSSVPTEKIDLLLAGGDTEDISHMYEWPPLICCYGSAQHAFIPSGRPANRLIDHEIHETMKDMFWSPTKFVRAPGGSASGVAIALASLGARVAFMGKVGDDEYGQCMLYHLNENKVQTRSVKIDTKKPTSISHMKISRRGGLRAASIGPCAEDSLSSSDINIDVLKEVLCADYRVLQGRDYFLNKYVVEWNLNLLAKMFYFNSSALLDSNMKATTTLAIEISKRLGGVIFFDLNLPFPLWQSREETRTLIQQSWNHADIIEVTKQELEFLLGIEPTEKFDTKDNDNSKFVHYKKDVVKPLWHDSLKVLYVTDGTSKINYYTDKDDGWVHGMEDAPITPFTAEMSASGDAVVAALMRMLTVQPHLVTDKDYLEHMIKYAIDCGVIDQWLASRTHGFPPQEGMEGVKSITEREYRTVGPDDDD